MLTLAQSGELAVAAKRIAESGWPVFPCRPRSKTPATPNGLKDATIDGGLVGGWWEQWPDANPAVRTGCPSGLVVLDVDGDAGRASLRSLEARHGALPETMVVSTPRGGMHFYFRHPGGDVRNSAGKLGTGLDIRGDGGYVLVPPAVGASGRRYRVEHRGPVAPLGWLAAAVHEGAGTAAHPGRPAPEPAGTWVRMVRDGLDEGERNQGIARFVGHLLARDIDARLVAELAHLVNGRARPPLPGQEVDRVVASIAGREVRRRLGGRS